MAFNPQPKQGIKKKSKEPTGELELFKEMWQEALDSSYPECPRCRCCNEPLGFRLDIWFFSHLLPKGLYNKFRLLKENIWIVCRGCHYDWGNRSRNVKKFEEKNKEYERLREKYNETVHGDIQRKDNKREES